MKKLVLILAIGLLILSPLASFATNITPQLFTPLIEWGLISYPAPNIVYDATAGIITMNGKITNFFGKTIVPPNPLVGGSVLIQGSLLKSVVEGSIVQGDFITMGLSSGYDVEVRDTNLGLAIGGNLKLMGINGIKTSNFAYGGFIFTPLAGYLLSDFLATGPYGGGLTMNFNILPAFSNNTFTYNFQGSAEGKIGATPEPGTLLLLGSGLIGFGVIARYRRNKK